MFEISFVRLFMSRLCFQEEPKKRRNFETFETQLKNGGWSIKRNDIARPLLEGNSRHCDSVKVPADTMQTEAPNNRASTRFLRASNRNLPLSVCLLRASVHGQLPRPWDERRQTPLHSLERGKSYESKCRHSVSRGVYPRNIHPLCSLARDSIVSLTPAKIPSTLE